MEFVWTKSFIVRKTDYALVTTAKRVVCGLKIGHKSIEESVERKVHAHFLLWTTGRNDHTNNTQG